MTKIIFTDTIGIDSDFLPKPATSYIPDWYKKIDSYTTGEKKPTGSGSTTATIKRCMPVFDSITSGYILTTYVDLYVSQKDIVDENNKPTGKKIPWYEWPSFNPVEWHPIIQAPNHPQRNNLPEEALYPKWLNPWSIKTPPGYSTLFTAPMHRESVFTILDGIVDTDKYISPVNFPFVLNNWEFEGIIPAGTPMAQVIPFKRESWNMEIGSKDELIISINQTKKLRTRFFDSYKTQFRQNKEYK